ncbi:MAG: class I SAM-dependent methyltransferase [Lewinellaceae bacterium]|nr:class I SAM-dependent methyltransferase [Lewinellaceae bacterium]
MEIVDFNTEEENTQVKTIRNYYQIHAKLYQATRWAFLFGRRQIIHALKLPMMSEITVVEVGCGTGHNLSNLANYYPNLRLIGIDISPNMLAVASKRLQRFSRRVLFLEKPYAPGNWKLPAKPDVLLFSYCLTMINPGWEQALQRASDDLEEGGRIAVVDFHCSPVALFRRWMGYNHVRMDKHLLPALEEKFKPVYTKVRRAYGGLWSYFLFVGEK